MCVKNHIFIFNVTVHNTIQVHKCHDVGQLTQCVAYHSWIKSVRGRLHQIKQVLAVAKPWHHHVIVVFVFKKVD